MPYIASLLIGYLIGSIPTAYLLVQWKTRVDIRAVGSGNVGAMNTFDVTRSKALGISVFFLDALKGFAAVFLSRALFGGDYQTSGVAGAAAVIGHIFPLWLRFKGGRGLSTGVGVFLASWWIVVPVWCIVWTLHFAFSRNVHYANITASLVAPVGLSVAPASWLAPTIPSNAAPSDALTLTLCVCLFILIGHTDFIRQQFSAYKQ